PARGRDGLAPVQPRGRRLPARRPALPSLPIIPQSADARATRRGPGPLTALGFRTKNDETASPGTDRPALPPQEPPMPRPTSPQALDQPRPDGARPLQAGPLAIVGGCGHVGLPLGLAFAHKGYEVDLVDTSPERVAQVNAGTMPFHEDDAEELLRQT